MVVNTIFRGGSVLTMDCEGTVHEAAAVSGNKIFCVGSDEEVMKLAGADTQIIDLKGRSLIPGLIDSHLHSAVFGLNFLAIDCRSPGVGSIEEIKELIRQAAAKTPKGQWIRGWGYDHSKLKEKRHPNKWDLDEAAPDHPVMLTRCCAHISTHNSKSLALGGIDDSSEAPEGGEYERIDGKVSGVMFENAHMDMMKVSMPDKTEIINAMKAANDFLVKQGITTVHDSGGYGATQMDAIQEASAAGILKLRMYTMIFSFVENVSFVNNYLGIGIHTGFGNEKYRLGPTKIMIDGSSSGPTAATLEPYASNPNSCGIMSMNQDQIEDIVLRAHKGGWQMTCHAIGDKAITVIMDALEKAIQAYPREDHRHRIEHSAMMNDELLGRMKKLGIVPVPQPVFLYEFGDGYMRNYGEKRAYRMFPCKSYVDYGIIAAGSSDCPITFSNPFLNMYMAANRKTQTGQVINEAECVTPLEALKMFTWNGAYASFEEGVKGSIEAGKLADLVVLSRDFLTTPREEIKDITADLTMIDGEIVYQA